MPRKPSQRELAKRRLIEAGSITNVEAFHMHILRLSERIRELQGEGMKIEGEWVFVDGKRTGTFKYRLLDHKPPMRMEYVLKDGVRVARMVPASPEKQQSML